jgi:uncharacterized tellurite resistance protein B-like protein
LPLLFLVPLVQIAWAHGAISPRERQLVFEAARIEGIDERDALNDRLADWMLNQPSRKFFDDCLELINEKLSQMTVREREQRKAGILAFGKRVAASAGGKSLMDIDHHISSEERETLDEIAAAMNRRPTARAFAE